MTSYILILTLLISDCGQKYSKSDNIEIGKQTNVLKNTNKQNQITEKYTKLESIEKANNESVVASRDRITKAYVFLKDGDSSINLTVNIKQDQHLF